MDAPSCGSETEELEGTLSLLLVKSTDTLGRICDQALFAAGAVRIEHSQSLVHAWFQGARKAVAAGSDLVRGNPDRFAAAVVTGDVEGSLGAIHLVEQAMGILDLAEEGQVLMSLATEELVRMQAQELTFFHDLGTRPVGAGKTIVRVFMLSEPGLQPSTLPVDSSQSWAYPANFVGRHRELAALMKLLDQARLITITGPRGIGKTALAARLELETCEQFEGGIAWVDLRSVTRSNPLLHRLAASLDIHSVQEGTLFEQITRKIGDDSWLLILDGADQLLEASAEVAERLLVCCPNLAIVATSLRRLACRSEIVYSLSGLECPPEGATIAMTSDCDAMNLFLRLARAVDPHFEIDERNLGVTCAIVNILEGSPWAIMLVVSRLSVLSPSQLLSRLKDDPLALLTERSESREDAPSSLRRVLQANLDLLSPWAKILFRRIGVFRGPFAADAAVSVSSSPTDLPPDAVLPALRELLEVHLVQPFRTHSLSRAFLMSSLCRELASEQLREKKEAKHVGRLHSEYIASTAARLTPGIAQGQTTALEEFDLIYEEVRESWLTGFANRRLADEALSSMIDCSSYWFQRGYFADGLDVAAAAERSPWASRSRLYARLTNLSAWCALRNGDFIKAKSGAKLAVRIAFERGSALDLIRALNTAGCVASELLKLRTAAKCLRQACLLVRELDDRRAYEAVFSNYAGVLSELGRADEAAETIKHVQDSPIGSRRWSHLTYLTNHAHLCLALGRPRDCWRSLSAACEQFLATPDPYGLSAMYATAAWACVQVGAVLEGRVLAAAHAAIVQHFALILSPRQQKSKDMVEWLAQTNSNKPSAWSPDSPLDILKNVLHNHAPSQ